MQKAVSELIVVVMILMMSVALVAGVYVFVTGISGQTTAEVGQSGSRSLMSLGSSMKIISFDSATNNLWIKNTGRYPIDNATIFIDNKPVGSVFINAEPNDIRNITISASEGVHEIKLAGDYASASVSVDVTGIENFDFSMSISPASGSI